MCVFLYQHHVLFVENSPRKRSPLCFSPKPVSWTTLFKDVYQERKFRPKFFKKYVQSQNPLPVHHTISRKGNTIRSSIGGRAWVCLPWRHCLGARYVISEAGFKWPGEMGRAGAAAFTLEFLPFMCLSILLWHLSTWTIAYFVLLIDELQISVVRKRIRESKYL